MKFGFVKYWLLLLILFATNIGSYASHIVGGELTYAYLGNNQYKFTLHLYRDCTSSTQFQTTSTIYFYKTTGYTDANLGTAASPSSVTLNNISGGTNGTTIAPYYYSPCLTYPSGLCVSEAIFTGTATLPPIAGGYTIIYQNCCRNAGITNFTVNSGGGGGGGTGSTYKCILPGIGNSADSSPVFTQLPPTAICQNQPFAFPCGAVDGDGDSLSYSLYTPFDGSQTTPSGYTTLSWVSPYSLTNFIGGTPALSVDPKTGVLTCYPSTAGRFVVGIRVDEYRNGVYIGSVYRDFQFNVTACSANVIAQVPNSTITTPTGTYDTVVLSCKYTTPTVKFTNNSTPQNTLSTYYWNFGDPTTNADTSNIASPTYTYSDTGSYRAFLVMNPGQLGTCTDTIWFNVRVYYDNKKGFRVATAGTLYTCQLIQFTDTTRGGPNPMSYYWTFGDGDTSHHQNPGHVYINSGGYTVTEIVQNAGGCKDTTKKSLTIISKYPTAAILNPLIDCSSDTINFLTPTVSANYLWNFGDPSTNADTSLLANPTYVYPADSGMYTVSLIINKGYPKTCMDTAYATLKVYPPFKAKFVYSPSMICINMPFQFTDSTKGIVMPNSWNWTFGDGDTSHHQNPTHTYTSPGTYTVKLISQNAKGCTDSMSITKTIYPVAIANIIAPSLNCHTNTVQFQTTGIAQTYFWNFGVKNISTDTSYHINPIYAYTDTGTYFDTLILNPGATGTCTDTATATIKVYSPFTIGYTYTPPYICRKNLVHFLDTTISIAKPLTWWWNLDDNNTISTVQNPFHTYNDSGRYHIKLVVQNRVGCEDSVTKLIGVFAPPTARISVAPLTCSGLTVNFQSLTYSGGYFWKFNDAGKSPNDTSWQFAPNYTFSDTGTFTTMFVVNPGAQDSCSDTAYATVRVYGPFVPKFGYFHAYNCPNHNVQFTDSSTGKEFPNQWSWNFGDTTFSASQNPIHVYKHAGTYQVKLIIQNPKGCMDSIVHTIVIDTQTHSNIIVPNLSCDSVIHFQTTAHATYWWNFGETASTKNTDTIQKPTHIYKSAGTYTATLIVYPNTGCADTSHKTIQVEFGIKANFIPINVCVYDSAEFFNTANGGPSALVPTLWYFGDADSIYSSSNIVKHKYAVANTYQVTQITTNTFGCKDTLKQNITIYPIPIINAGRDTSICDLDTISLQAFGGANYVWTPNYAMDDSTLQFPTVTPDVTTKYFVEVTTTEGCSAMDSVIITNVNPKSDGIIKDTTMCYGDTIQLKAPIAAGNLYVWSPSLTLSNDTASKPLAFPLQKTIYQVYIRNGNCIRYDTAIVKVKILATPNAGNDVTICNNLSTTLHATHGTTYSWSPTTNMLYSNTPDPVVDPKVTTTYYVTVVDTTVCLKPETDSLTVFVDHFKNGEVQNDTNIVKNIPSTLYAYGGNQYLWKPSTGLDDSTSATPTCTLQNDQVYIIKISDGNGCFNYDTLKVFVFPNPIALMPNAFSPNGDGLDDVIMPVYAGIRILNHFNIYNRWGQCVFSTTEMNQGWDGTFHGVQQPMDTYVYLLDGVDVEGNGFNYKGDITLIR